MADTNAFVSFADSDGDVQVLNAGNSDNGTPIFFELETQEIDFGNRLHLYKMNDKMAAFADDGAGTVLQASQNGKEYEPIDINLGERVNISESLQLEGHYFTFKWSGETSSTQPIFEGIYIEQINDMGFTHG